MSELKLTRCEWRLNEFGPRCIRAAQLGWKNCFRHSEPQHVAEAAEQFLEAVHTRNSEIASLKAELAALKAADRWIPVTERLPPHRVDVLTFGEEQCVGYLHRDMWFHSSTAPMATPTHWRELPHTPIDTGE